jgi:hypothetical protein
MLATGLGFFFFKIFFFQFCDVCKTSDHQEEEDLAKCGYRSDMKLQ